MIDILQKIIDSEITEEAAYAIVEDMEDQFHSGELNKDPKDELNLNDYEWTAICHTASLGVLAKWRKHGWPKHCSVCGTKIDYKKFGWIVRDDKLVGLSCHKLE